MKQLEIKTEMVTNEDVINALKGIMSLPDRITRLDLELRIDEFPKVNLEFIPTKTEENGEDAEQLPNKSYRIEASLL